MKKIMAVMVVVLGLILQACSSASYTVKSASGEFKYEGRVWESMDEISWALWRAAKARGEDAEADLIWANAALLAAAAKAVEGDPSLLRDFPLRDSQNDQRKIYRSISKSSSDSGGGFTGYRWDPNKSATENAQAARAEVCAKNPKLTGCR